MNNSYLKSFTQFFSANFIVRFISLLREMILAWFVGPSKILDIFFFITTVPNLINATWNKAIETILLTRYETDINDSTVTEAKRRLAKRMASLVIFSFVIYLLLSALFPIIIYFFYYKIFSNRLIYAVFFVNIALIVETYIVAVKVIKFSEQQFFLPSIIPAVQSVIMIAGIIFIKDKLTVFYLSIIYSVGSFLQLSILFKKEFWALRESFKTHFDFNSIKDVLKDSTQLSLAAGISSLNLFVDQSFALSLGESANSYIHYGNYFLTVYSVLFVRNINTIFFPQFQKYALNKKHHLLISDTEKIIKLILMIGTVILLFTVNNGYFVLKTMLGHGKVMDRDIEIIYYCTLGYGGAFFGTALNAILIRILHVYMEYKLILKVALVNFFVNIVLNYILVKSFGVWGLALSTSITILLIVIIYFIYLEKKRHLVLIKFSRWHKKYLSVLLILLVMEAVIYFLLNTFIIQSFVLNLLVFGVSVLIVIGLFSVFKMVDIKKFKINFN